MFRRKKIVPIILLGLAAIVLTGAKVTDRSFEISRNLDIFHSIFRDVDMMYVDTVDVEPVIQAGIDAMLSKLDPYTVYYPQDEEDDLKMMTTGKYGGIGALIRQFPKRDYIVIEEPYENKPAAVSGAKAGDAILRIDGEDMKGKSSQYVSDHLRGEPGTEFILTVRRPGVPDSLDIRIKRENIALPAVPYYGMWKDAGYIILDSFTDNCSKEVRRALVDLKEMGAKYIVLDLRDNGGGLLDEAIEVVSLFVPKGTLVVQTKGKTKMASSTYSTSREPVDADIPMAVLTNGNSASASEIVSGALQDLDRAVVVGTRTFGKGLVQTTRSLPFNGTLKVTTAKYYIPSGRCIQKIDYARKRTDGGAGLTPDSLTRVFATKSGREVRDGGGIRPDINCTIDTLPEIVYYLSTDVVVFDFVNDFCISHPSVDTPETFHVSDSLYQAFKNYVCGSEFEYVSQSSKALKSIRDIARVEGLLDGAAEAFDSLEVKLTYDISRDLDMFRDDIESLLASEILSRYYYQKGVVRYNLPDDATLDSAVTVLSNAERYSQILAGPEGKKKSR